MEILLSLCFPRLCWFEFLDAYCRLVASLFHIPSLSKLLGNWEETKFHQSHQILMSKTPLSWCFLYWCVWKLLFHRENDDKLCRCTGQPGSFTSSTAETTSATLVISIWWIFFDSSGYIKKNAKTKKNTTIQRNDLECCDFLVLNNIHLIITFHMEKWSTIPWVQLQLVSDHRTLEHGLFAHLLNRKDPQVQHLNIPHIPQFILKAERFHIIYIYMYYICICIYVYGSASQRSWKPFLFGGSL